MNSLLPIGTKVILVKDIHFVGIHRGAEGEIIETHPVTYRVKFGNDAVFLDHCYIEALAALAEPTSAAVAQDGGTL